MGACYTADARFGDPVFPALAGDDARAMWAMLCARAKEFRLEFSDVRSDGTHGSAHWEAWYLFSATGRRVHNVITAEFTFRDGLIATHVDRFSFHRWSRQALGLPGLLLGWTPFLRGQVRRQAAEGLRRWRSGTPTARTA